VPVILYYCYKHWRSGLRKQKSTFSVKCFTKSQTHPRTTRLVNPVVYAYSTVITPHILADIATNRSRSFACFRTILLHHNVTQWNTKYYWTNWLRSKWIQCAQIGLRRAPLWKRTKVTTKIKHNTGWGPIISVLGVFCLYIFTHIFFN
jgi:hypothetical protein